MSGFNLEQTARSTEQSIREAGFDPAEVLKTINTAPPGTDPPPVSVTPVAKPPAPAPGNTEIPDSPVREIRSGESVQYHVRIPENVQDMTAFVENAILKHLTGDGVHAPVSDLAAGKPVVEVNYDDEALLAELAAWFAWKAGGGGNEPTLPFNWRQIALRVWQIADVSGLTFTSTNGALRIEGLTPAQRAYIYLPESLTPPAGTVREPGAVYTPGALTEAGTDWSFLDDPDALGELGANPVLGNLPAPVGGRPMTMVAGGGLASVASRLWPLIKQYGGAAVVSWLVSQGVSEDDAQMQVAEASAQGARSKRRRRRRMLTCSDKEDIQFLIGVLGKGEMGKTAVASLLAGCRR